MKRSPGELRELINQVCDPSWEPGFDQYSQHLVQLNRIVRESGVALEGSLFAEHLRETISDTPVPIFRNKRSNYAIFCCSADSILEIGLNAGHSALLGLTMNPDLVYTAVDICFHSYTQPCFEYLKSVFGDRIRLISGDSRDVIPVLRDEGRTYDLFHLDGGHNFWIAHADLCNMIDFADREATILVDDVDDHMIASLCDYYVIRGRLSRMKLSRLWQETNAHELFRIHPKR